MTDGDSVLDTTSARDPGLARERTELAWHRSGLGVLVVVTIMLRRLWPLNSRNSALALGLIAVGASAWIAGMLLTKHARSSTLTNSAMAESHCRMMTIGTFLLAAAGFLVGVLLPG